MIEEAGIDSVQVNKFSDGTYVVNFQATGAYEDFKIRELQGRVRIIDPSDPFNILLNLWYNYDPRVIDPRVIDSRVCDPRVCDSMVYDFFIFFIITNHWLKQ